MNKYLAVTIGPIFNTIGQARKTRELWAASYLFSRLMELIAEKLDQAGAQIILPKRVKANKEERYGAGIYNDRLFAVVNDLTEDSIDQAINQAIRLLATEVAVNWTEPDVDFWLKFLRVSWVVKEIKSVDNGELIHALSPFLDTAELSTPYFQNNPKKDRFLELLDALYKTELAKALHQSKGKYKHLMAGLFPSTSDIGTLELFQKSKGEYEKLYQKVIDEANEDTDTQSDKIIQKFYEALYVKGSPFEPYAKDYHKYFCIVYADADNISATIKTLNTEKSYSDFSEELGRYALEAAEIISDFGGKPVFIGGDDLLFFAPVCALNESESKSIFHLIHRLNAAFAALNLEGNPTLSFGITITYYKFPLFEANQLCYEQLAYHAKKIKWKTGEKKNAVAFRLLRHSGAYFEGVLSKDMLNKFVAYENQIRAADSDLISSIVYKLESMKGLLEQLNEAGMLQGRLSWLFENFFNEAIHKRNKHYMALIEDLLSLTYASSFTIEHDSFDQNKNLYSILRVLKFITDKPVKGRGGAKTSNNSTAVSYEPK